MFEGCPAEDSRVPFETKEFNMSEYLEADRAEDFVGRQWLFREVEDAFEEENIAGVQIIGSPGSGKSALASQLICSRTSSSFIHGRILGYHVCKYSDKNTQMAGKFVRNLAEMIARRLPEYGYIVTNSTDSTYIQRSLTEDCIHHQDPVGCFELAVLSPLRNLKNKPRKNWFLVVDALDECLTQGETGHSIVFLLNNKIHRFPPWLKVVMTSRNESYASLHSSKVKKITIDPDDSRNLKDLEIFVTKRLFKEGPLLQRITWWLGDDSVTSITKLATQVLSTSQGNFLFVTELLKDWENSRQELRNAYVLPKTLRDLFHSYFERLYLRKGSFRPVRHILELLVSTFEPLTQNQMFDLLKVRENSLDEYDFKDRLRELGHFLKIGKDNTLTLYHLSLTEWLTSEENQKYFVSKKKGHETFCDYYFGVIGDRTKNRTKNYTLALAQHIVLGGSKEAHVQEFLSLPSQTINSSDLQNNRTLLHGAATIDNRDALELVSRHFSCVDCVDNRGITPAFLAAERGFVDNLAFLVKKGAKINHKTKTMVAFYKANFVRGSLNLATEELMENYLKIIEVFMENYLEIIDEPVDQSKSKHFDSTMLHAAAQRGRVSVVHFLVENNAFLSLSNGVQQTAIQIAAEKGHLEVVKSLYKAGAFADQTALYHAAANDRLEVVNFLLDSGVKDECLRCDGSFYWVKGTSRLPGRLLTLTPPFSSKDCLLMLFGVANNCFDSENIWPAEKKTLFDDEHLIFCHSALHAAVASGHNKVVTRLLSEKHNALDCHDYSGRTPLHEAVQKHETIIVNLLLEKQSQMIHKKCKHWQELDKKQLDVAERMKYYEEVCHCGYTPLHLAARYGHHQLATLLIRKGARVDDQDCSGATPLHLAALYGLADTVNVLLNMNATVEMKDKHGKTPLEVVLEHASVVSEPENPREVATKSNGHVMVICLLLSTGASSRLKCMSSESVTIECGKPFNYSLFHLLSYLSPAFKGNNFFFSENCSEPTHPNCTVKKGPLAKAIESHPEKQLIISSCFDAEGFTPLHRAAQGVNLVAIRYLLANGADDSILNPQGYDALKLAVLHAGRKRLWELHGLTWMDEDIRHLIEAEQAAIELLRHAVKTRGYKIRCDSTKAELTLYHLAASRGLVNFIKVIFNETDLGQLDVDCANLDGITPLYLAELFQQGVRFGLDNRWKELIRFLKQRGGKTRDPTKDAEHSIIFNTVFGFFPNKFTLDLRPDVVHFVTSLLTSYEKSGDESFRCSSVSDLDHKHYYDYLPVLRLRRNIDKVLQGLPEDDRWKHFWGDFTRCSYQVDEFKRNILSFFSHTKAYLKDTKNKSSEILSMVQRNWFQKQLLILMKTRHTEVFRSFACLKSLFSRLKSVFHFDARPVTSIVREYEKCPPVNIYLRFICGSLTLIFEHYKLISSQLPVPEGEKELFSRLGSTILELLLKRSLGFFRKYDYLKTLQVGLKPGTQLFHISMAKYIQNNSDELVTLSRLVIELQSKAISKLAWG